ncbi:hypothetical protein [Variovorax terrae]|uniref:DUF2782 domain-containing protein n=1 Tax=Variovorax terrae TaxID=2923278 RepID=A0A9X2ANU2_9BURK|nr:hypothetical protein [Variovorax terrae]MCJ0764135.1 hypothetical protein [Variovorax terrae]
MRAVLLSLLLVAAGSAALAQNPAPNALPAPPGGQEPLTRSGPAALRGDQRIERIRVEDGGSRIDEVRYGGETQSITVQPKANVPEYEVLPLDGARSRPNGLDTPGPTGQRVWNVIKF